MIRSLVSQAVVKTPEIDTRSTGKKNINDIGWEKGLLK